MDQAEVKLRCIEAAAKNPTPNPKGFAVGVLEAAGLWAEWVWPSPQKAAPKTAKDLL
jgi:hypothetical protein